MIKVNTNKIIQQTSLITKFIVWIIIALICSKAIWWIINPTGYNIVENPALINNNANEYASSIANRAAFGMITTTNDAPSNQPAFADQIKLIGVYAAGANNSMAFVQVSGQAKNVQIGDLILNGKVIAITPTSIVVNLDSKNITIEMSSGSSTPNQPSSNSPTAQNNNALNPIVNSDKDSQNVTSPNNNSQDNNDNNIADKRQKMIQEFQQQNNSSNN